MELILKTKIRSSGPDFSNRVSLLGLPKTFSTQEVFRFGISIKCFLELIDLHVGIT